MQFGNSPRYSNALGYTIIICTELEAALFELASHICRCARNLINLINKTLSKRKEKKNLSNCSMYFTTTRGNGSKFTLMISTVSFGKYMMQLDK